MLRRASDEGRESHIESTGNEAYTSTSDRLGTRLLLKGRMKVAGQGTSKEGSMYGSTKTEGFRNVRQPTSKLGANPSEHAEGELLSLTRRVPHGEHTTLHCKVKMVGSWGDDSSRSFVIDGGSKGSTA